MSNDLVNFLRYDCDRNDIPRGVRVGIRRAADRIESLEAENKRLRGVVPDGPEPSDTVDDLWRP